MRFKTRNKVKAIGLGIFGGIVLALGVIGTAWAIFLTLTACSYLIFYHWNQERKNAKVPTCLLH